MAVTKQQALTHDRFHFEAACTATRTERWRRNGKTKVWVTRPDDYRVPIKYGLREYSYLDNDTAHRFHTEADCPHGHI